MKMKRFAAIMAGLFVIAAVFGAIFRFSYTNVSQGEGYPDQLHVGLIPEAICVHTCQEMEGTLPSAPVILRVTPVSEIEYLFSLGQQRVAVQQIFAGDTLASGDEIYLTFHRWSVSTDNAIPTLERGFINFLKVGSDYLVFAQAYDGLLYEDTPVYRLYGETTITPVFCYEDIPNHIVPISENSSTYVPYSQVSSNEFFTVSETGLQSWLQLKTAMLQAYPLRLEL